jgi:hypothetical protein
MKKSLSMIIVLTFLLQLLSFSTVSAEETILATYKAADTLDVWNANTSPWQYHAKMWETGNWVLMSVGATVGNFDSSTTYKTS